MTEPMRTAETRISLPNPRAILDKLCAHFTEHGTVTRSDNGGRIENQFGFAALELEPGALHVRAGGVDDTALYVVKSAIADHLVMFANEDVPSFVWSGEATAAIPFFREMVVVGSHLVTPGMRRVTLRGDDAHFDNGQGLHVRVLIPPAGRTPMWPHAAPDGRTIWPKGEDALICRVYTVRSIDMQAGALDIDVVQHEDSHVPAPGSNWAAGAMAGERVGLMGPGGGMLSPADWYLFAGDETALPVIARMVESLSADQRAIVLIEVANAGEEQPIALPPQVELTWLHRDGAAPGSTSLLEDAIRALYWPPAEGRGVALIGCEHGAARAIRSLLRKERGMDKKDCQVAAYWRRGASGDRVDEQE